MPRNTYAHTVPGSQTTENWQTLEEHHREVADFAVKFALPFDSSDWARNAALLHDLGKVDARFQRKLFTACGIPFERKADSGQVNHSNAGAAYAELNLSPGVGRTLAYLVAGHHAGLPDYFNGWAARLEDAQENLKKIENGIEPYVSDLYELKALPGFVTQKNYHLWVRMLFSCLVDADWLDTERFMNRARFDARPKFPQLSELSGMFEEYMLEIGKRKASSLNELRNKILEHCRNAAKKEPGLFSLTVPTGGGKTLSSMAFALQHAMECGKERIIYVIPYTSIIEQTAKELRKIFGNDNVLEHHSNVVRDDENKEKKSKKDEDESTPMDLAAENWDAPIIVTTNVQFFESLYAAKPRRCRKIHNIVNSVVIIDEAQLISPEHLDPCVDVIKHLTKSFKTTVVLCTATQSRPKVLEHASEIIPEPKDYYEALKRTQIHFPDDLTTARTWEDLAEELKTHEKVLCIVNTRMDCRELYDLMRNGNEENTIHLSALMCGEHRSAVIEEIKRRLNDENDKRPLRVISTQLVEAGVDMDFPVVYRALAGLDSIVQAAGRCNREGKLPELGQVYVFVPPKPAPKGLLAKGVDTTIELMASESIDTDDHNVFQRYFELFFNKIERGNNFSKKYRKMLIEEVCLGKDDEVGAAVEFRTFGEMFKLIDDECSFPILVPYGNGKELIKQLQDEGPSRILMRKLQRFTINLDKKRVNAFMQSGAIQKVPIFGKESDILSQNTSEYFEEYYTDKLGFDITKANITAVI